MLYLIVRIMSNTLNRHSCKLVHVLKHSVGVKVAEVN